ncbi:MAG TPA: hypothetical protein VFA05_02530 [Gaiellaceae bacterium]|nr:hypothetical protein [Gaiellaceae bacterium]
MAGDITLGKPGVPLHLSIKVETTGHVSHTGQILFPDPITTQVYALTPYSAETVPRTYNSQDRVYAQQGGARSMLTLHRLGSSLGAGFAGAITLVVDPGATPVKVGA